MNLDARLRRALQPVEPPDDFARRVRARVERQKAASATKVASRDGGWRSWLATAAAVAGVMLGTYGYQQYEQRREAITARAQVLLALQIASRELNTVQRAIVRTPDEPAAATDGVPAGDER
jgi:hypothetical protein